jgi:hypothetical protein
MPTLILHEPRVDTQPLQPQVALGAGVVAVGAYALNRLLKPYVISAYDRCSLL